MPGIIPTPLESVDIYRHEAKERAIMLFRKEEYEQVLGALWWAIHASKAITDEYETRIDFDVYSIIQQMASKILDASEPKPKRGKKIKLGYLTEGFDYTQAPLQNLLKYVKYHDKDRFDITIYSRYILNESVDGKKWYSEGIKQFKELGAKVSISPKPESHIEGVKAMLAEMRNDDLDILCTYTYYTNTVLCLLCNLKPAPIMVKDCWQMPEYSKLFDVTIHSTSATYRADWNPKILIQDRWECPIVNTKTRSELGLPDGKTLIASMVRYGKAVNRKTIECITQLLNDNPDTYWVIMGGQFGEHIHDRLIGLGRVNNVHEILSVCDFFIDNFPLGGGKALADAVFAGLPVLMFGKDKGSFNIQRWTIPEIPNNPELTIARWDFDTWQKTANRLVRDTTYRKEMSEITHKRAKEIGNVQEMVKEREAVLLSLYENKLGK